MTARNLDGKRGVKHWPRRAEERIHRCNCSGVNSQNDDHCHVGMSRHEVMTTAETIVLLPGAIVRLPGALRRRGKIFRTEARKKQVARGPGE